MQGNPTLALFEMMKNFRIEVQQYIKLEFEKLKDIKLKTAYGEHVDFLKGLKGEDSKPEEVAQLLLDNPEFLAAVKPNDGHTPTTDELSAIIGKLLPSYIPAPVKGDPGETPTITELKRLIRPIVQKLKPKDGKAPTQEEIVSITRPVIEALLTKYLAKMNGKFFASELNKYTNIVDLSVLKGFEEKWNQLLKLVQSKQTGRKDRPASGGMGNWVHQRFALTSATTSVTLSSKVAANGLAHIVRYQGQVLMYGVQYTISGKTLTLLFTPNNSTNLDIAFVRT